MLTIKFVKNIIGLPVRFCVDNPLMQDILVRYSPGQPRAGCDGEERLSSGPDKTRVQLQPYRAFPVDLEAYRLSGGQGIVVRGTCVCGGGDLRRCRRPTRLFLQIVFSLTRGYRNVPLH